MEKENSNKLMAQRMLKAQERTLVRDVGEFLVFLEEGSSSQVEYAKNHAKSTLLKHGPEMQKLAETISDGIPEKVEIFLQQVDILLHSAPGWVDDAKIFSYYESAHQLETKLREAA
jgi:hypothetical protein